VPLVVALSRGVPGDQHAHQPRVSTCGVTPARVVTLGHRPLSSLKSRNARERSRQWCPVARRARPEPLVVGAPLAERIMPRSPARRANSRRSTRLPPACGRVRSFLSDNAAMLAESQRWRNWMRREMPASAGRITVARCPADRRPLSTCEGSVGCIRPGPWSARSPPRTRSARPSPVTTGGSRSRASVTSG
jgi:hypothetical protein